MNTSKQNNDGGIFINGRQQIIEMLRIMDTKEKSKLINNLKARNAPMAKELSEQSLSFLDLQRLSDDDLKIVTESCNPQILGLALAISNVELQRKVLGCLERSKAEIAFQIMSSNLSTKRLECQKAQMKIITSAIHMSQKGLITLL